MKAVKAEKRKAQETKEKLLKLGVWEYSHEIGHDEKYVYFPVNVSRVKGFKVVDFELKEKEVAITTLRDALRGKIPEKKLALVPHAYDVTGDIAVIEVEKDIEKYEKIIAEALLKLNKNIKVVLKKAGAHSGPFRTQKMIVLAGEDRKTTVHKENNVRLMVNVETCYFSPRLSTERRRIIDLVKPGEKILVMFSGVAPYPIVLAKNTLASEIYGVELNPEAHEFGLKNIELNKVKNVKLFCGDVKTVVPKLNVEFDRILMPLPKTADEFLKTAIAAAKPNAVIHFYDFADEREFPDSSIKKILKEYKAAKILNSVKCGQSAPGQFRVCIDFEL